MKSFDNSYLITSFANNSLTRDQHAHNYFNHLEPIRSQRFEFCKHHAKETPPLIQPLKRRNPSNDPFIVAKEEKNTRNLAESNFSIINTIP